MAAVVQLTVGSTFSSFESLEAEIKAYQSKKFVQLVKRDTRTLEMARKRVPKRVEGIKWGMFTTTRLVCLYSITVAIEVTYGWYI